jgi:hypothetical protein
MPILALLGRPFDDVAVVKPVVSGIDGAVAVELAVEVVVELALTMKVTPLGSEGKIGGVGKPEIETTAVLDVSARAAVGVPMTRGSSLISRGINGITFLRILCTARLTSAAKVISKVPLKNSHWNTPEPAASEPQQKKKFWKFLFPAASAGTPKVMPTLTREPAGWAVLTPSAGEVSLQSSIVTCLIGVSRVHTLAKSTKRTAQVLLLVIRETFVAPVWHSTTIFTLGSAGHGTPIVAGWPIVMSVGTVKGSMAAGVAGVA